MRNPGLNVCPIPILGFAECPSENYSFTGKVIVGQTYDLSAAVVEPHWALGFEFVGKAYDSRYRRNLFNPNSIRRIGVVDTNGYFLITDPELNTAYSLTAPNGVLTLNTSPGIGTGTPSFDIYGNPLIYDTVNDVFYSLTSPDGVLTLSTNLGVGTVGGHYDNSGNVQTSDAANALWYSLTAPGSVLTLSGSSRYGINVQQAYFYNSLRLLNCSQVNSTTAQMADSYNTPSGLVLTQFQVAFDISAKTITLGNLLTQLPQQSAFRACAEILVAYWRVTVFNYPVQPTEILLPYNS